ncbi:prolipoprotein diacylglyceryl transferase [Janibacter hoylei]|uniref:prolipoprotein diacylglyceryl transferase n=1 Tax=Janibacter hoylei TaxID=364298 RepID=UPI0022380E99|nr:prolipoprotein diacylglyceryl transferase [Janibacter hoylei]MCW4600465.1 prolipoprotein diacylglyceryl transferase [Janibacter hoylei]
MDPSLPTSWTPSMTHDLWVGLGVLTAGGVLALEKWRRGVSDERIWALVALAVGFGAVGARLGTWLQHLQPSANDPLAVHWLYGNRSILGGLAFAYVAVLVGKRLLRMQWRTGALFAPAVAAGMAVGRVGCLLTEPPGTATDVPWAVTVTSTADAAAWGVPLGTRLHPSFAYEIAFHLLALLAIWICRDRLADAADLFTLYITGYALFRFGVEAVRGNEVAWLGLTRPQLFLAATLPLLIWRSAVAVRRQPQGVEHGPAPAIG